MRGFRNAIERGFGRWHGVDISGMDEMCHAAVSKCCYSYSWQRCHAAVSKCYRKRLNRFWELATCHAAVSICYRNRSGELARIFWTWQCAEAAARHQGWMRRAMQQFRNVIERRFRSWHGVLGLGKMLHRLFFSELASSEAASRGFTGVKHAAVCKCYI